MCSPDNTALYVGAVATEFRLAIRNQTIKPECAIRIRSDYTLPPPPPPRAEFWSLSTRVSAAIIASLAILVAVLAYGV